MSEGRVPVGHERAVERLDDYLDGALEGGARRELEAHLEACAACRAELARLRALVEAAADLPRSIEPPRDLWPAIDARLEGGPERRARGAGRVRRYAWAAAAVLLIAVSSTVTLFLVERGGERPGDAGGVGPASPSVAAVQWRMLEREYEGAAAELRETVAALEGRLSPETRRIVEENLAVIDGAIEEARAALARDPANRELAELLGSAYRQKLDVLRQVARL